MDLHDSHEEHCHVEHGGDAQGDLLPGLGWNQENKPEIRFFNIHQNQKCNLFQECDALGEELHTYLSPYNLVLCQISYMKDQGKMQPFDIISFV